MMIVATALAAHVSIAVAGIAARYGLLRLFHVRPIDDPCTHTPERNRP